MIAMGSDGRIKCSGIDLSVQWAVLHRTAFAVPHGRPGESFGSPGKGAVHLLYVHAVLPTAKY